MEIGSPHCPSVGCCLRQIKDSFVAASALSVILPSLLKRAIRSNQRMKFNIMTAKIRIEMIKRRKRPADPSYPFSNATIATMLKTKAPIKKERVFCEMSSAITSGEERGVAVLLAEE